MPLKRLSYTFFAVISFILVNSPEFIASNANKWLGFFGYINIPTWVYKTRFCIILSLLVMVVIIPLVIPVLKKIMLKSKVEKLKQEKTYNWGSFNSSLEAIHKLVEQGALIVDNPINNHRNHKNIFERLIKEGEIRFRQIMLGIHY